MSGMMDSYRLNAVKVRLSDSAVLAGVVSLLYAVALVVYPIAFPGWLKSRFAGGLAFSALAIGLVAANEILFLLISKRRARKPDLLTAGYIALLTVAVVFLFRFLVMMADAQMQLSELSHRTAGHVLDGMRSEELLIYTHLILVSAIVLPYLLVRLTQNYVSDVKSADHEAKARNAVAGL
jgi:hypothetical protein